MHPSIIHPTHITIYNFEEQWLAQSILTVKNNDSWTFLFFFVFTIVFSLELSNRLYYLSITTMTNTSPAQMGSSRA